MGQFLNAAEIILRRHGKPMKVASLTEEALSARLLDECDGKTPTQTMKAKLSVDIKRSGSDSRFMRVAPGVFALRASSESEYVAKPFQKVVKNSEDVLAFPTRLLKEIGWFHGIRRDVRRYSPLLASENTKVLGRIEAETNLAYKQVISYVIIRRKGAVLRFVRGSYSSAQSFLKGRLCIGFGGHVQGDDRTLFDENDSGYLNSVARELSEELKLTPAVINEDTLQMVGVLNDDTSIVGKLHFGFVHILDLDTMPDPVSARSLKREKSINQLRFVSINRLGDDYERYEYWSKLCIQEYFKGGVRICCRVQPVRNFSLAKHAKNIAVVGTIGSGKTEVARMLRDEFGYTIVNTGVVLQEILGVSMKKAGRRRVQNLAERFIRSPSGPPTLADAIFDQMRQRPEQRYLIDGLRNLATFELLRVKLRRELAVIYVDSTADNAFSFYREREEHRVSFEEFIDILQHPVEADIPDFMRVANVVIFNHGSKRSYQNEVRRYFDQELSK